MDAAGRGAGPMAWSRRYLRRGGTWHVHMHRGGQRVLREQRDADETAIAVGFTDPHHPAVGVGLTIKIKQRALRIAPENDPIGRVVTAPPLHIERVQTVGGLDAYPLDD